MTLTHFSGRSFMELMANLGIKYSCLSFCNLNQDSAEKGLTFVYNVHVTFK